MFEFASHLSLLPFLFAIELLAIHLAIRHAAKCNNTAGFGWIYGLLFLLAGWGVISTWLALRGVYESHAFLESYPTLWLPLVPVAVMVVPLMLFASTRDSVRALIDATPVRWIVGIHAFRVLAIGTVLKAWKGLFSVSFATYVGIPDFMFGLSAVVMIWLALKDRISTTGLMAWNIAGVLVIYPGAPVIGQMGLPGAFYSINETPSVTTLFEFPMVLGPSLVVPIFVVMNLFVAIRLFETSLSPHSRNSAGASDVADGSGHEKSKRRVTC